MCLQVPAIMGMLGVWYNNFFGAQSHALLPYDQVGRCDVHVCSGVEYCEVMFLSPCSICTGLQPTSNRCVT